MKLVGIAAQNGNVANGHRRGLHHLRGLGQTHTDKKFLGRAALAFLKQLTEVTAVELAHRRDLLDRQISLVILLHKMDSLLNVEILQLDSVRFPLGGRGLDQSIQEQTQVPNLMEGRSCGIAGDIQHRVLEFLGQGEIL